MSQLKRHDTGPHATGADRRRSPRVLVDLVVDYAQEANFLFAYITDLSATGIFIRTTTPEPPEPPGTHLNLRFMPPPPPSLAQLRAELGLPEEGDDLPGADADASADADFDLDLEITNTRELAFDTALEVEGEVIWVNAYRPGAPDNLNPGMGVRFIGLDEGTKLRLYELVKRIAYLT